VQSDRASGLIRPESSASRTIASSSFVLAVTYDANKGSVRAADDGFVVGGFAVAILEEAVFFIVAIESKFVSGWKVHDS
jgi:hypothetical protein